VFSLRLATPADLETLIPRVLALNTHEAIVLEMTQLRTALGQLLSSPSLGAVFLILDGDRDIGYALTTFAFDLEFGGREAWLTEIWIDEPARGTGAGAATLTLLEAEMRARDVRALHLQVRRENPAYRLYERLGFEASPRVVMTRRYT
jgi:ribosomal protein S18 acetylase RimI-like enzyme